MKRRYKIIIILLIVVLAGLLIAVGSIFFNDSPDLNLGDKNILVLAVDKNEQTGGGLDMAFMVRLDNGTLANYTPIYPGGMTHPNKTAPGGLSGPMYLHDSLWNGPEEGIENAKEIVEYNTGMHADAVVIVYDTGLDAVIDSIRPLEVNGVVTNLSAVDIVRQNDNYAGYAGRDTGITGNMSRGDAVLVLAEALAQAAQDPDKRDTMINVAIQQYNEGNIIMEPQDSFVKLMATKGLESLIGSS